LFPEKTMRALSASLTSPRGWRWLAVAALICASCLVQAQAQQDDGGTYDPPSRVARLSYRSGDVGMLPSGEKDWGDASLNRPLTTGDRLSTGHNSRAELELGGGALRIADDSDFGFLSLNDRLTQVELTKGTLNLSVRGLADGQSYEIDTPTVALVVDQPGTYRVDIADDGKSTRVIDINGRAVVYGENNTQRNLNPGRTYEFNDPALNDVLVSDVDGRDSFDAWCASRDQRYARPTSGRYVSDEVVGYQDLDQYGDWQSDPEYGQVWYPSNVAAGWAPYRDGHWAYVAPWGWTWVDDSPWGFAPYHYGRWAYVRGAWGWVPGPIAVRPVYAPALVAFVGGSNWSVSVGIGGGAPVGWFPLGPGEVYNPWYHCTRNYYTNVNVTNIYVHNERNVVINNINNQYNYFRNGQSAPNMRYANRDAPRAFTAMSGQDFASARNARNHMMSVDPQRFAAAPVTPRGAAVQPTQASFVPPRQSGVRALPQGGFNREVVARHAPDTPLGGRNFNPNVANRPQPAAAPAPTNVRLLNEPAPGNRFGQNQPNRGAGPLGASVAQPERANANANPNVQRQPDVRQQAVQQDERSMMRPGELPSARFAHPRNDMATGDRATPAPSNQPRPGVSYIPNAESERQRAQPAPGALPNVPRFERPSPDQGNVQNTGRAPVNQDNGPRYQRDGVVSRPEFQQPREMPQPREAQPPREIQQPRQVQPPPEMPQRAYQPQPRNFEPPPQRNFEPPRVVQAPPQYQPQPQMRPPQVNNPPPPPQHASPPPPNQGDHHPGHKDDQHN